MKYVVAVSGGVDSVVLLDMLVRQGGNELMVAHFDHGIRDDSAEDARFVAGLAGMYGLQFETERQELGQGTSEEEARIARYDFLKSIADKNSATLVTAHHQDDLIETITINCTRGTGWRGLAVFGDASIERPLLTMTKRDIYGYAMTHDLEWVEDSTNASDEYLRNRIRRKLARLNDAVRSELVARFKRQHELSTLIDQESNSLLTGSRYFLTMIDEFVALELLRASLAAYGLSLTRPQRLRLLHAIKTARSGSTYEAGAGVSVQFTLRDFIVKHP